MWYNQPQTSILSILIISLIGRTPLNSFRSNIVMKTFRASILAHIYKHNHAFISSLLFLLFRLFPLFKCIPLYLYIRNKQINNTLIWTETHIEIMYFLPTTLFQKLPQVLFIPQKKESYKYNTTAAVINISYHSNMCTHRNEFRTIKVFVFVLKG